MVARSVQYVQLVDLSPDAVELSVEVLYGRGVLLLEAAAQEAADNGGLAHLGGAKDDHAVAVLGWDVQLGLIGAHLLDHGCQLSSDCVGSAVTELHREQSCKSYKSSSGCLQRQRRLLWRDRARPLCYVTVKAKLRLLQEC